MYNYSYLTTSADISDADYAALGGALGGVFAGMIMAIYLISIAIGVLTIIANWKIFTKAGQAGWKSLIPIYNIVILFKKTCSVENVNYNKLSEDIKKCFEELNLYE